MKLFLLMAELKHKLYFSHPQSIFKRNCCQTEQEKTMDESWGWWSAVRGSICNEIKSQIHHLKGSKGRTGMLAVSRSGYSPGCDRHKFQGQHGPQIPTSQENIPFLPLFGNSCSEMAFFFLFLFFSIFSILHKILCWYSENDSITEQLPPGITLGSHLCCS